MKKEKEKNQDKELSCGLIMPISSCPGYSTEHWIQIRKILEESISEINAISEYKFNVKMVSESETISIIQSTIIKNLYNNDMIICDVSSKNPNVMFELGMRLAFNKPVIIIKDFDTDYTFDAANIRHIMYPKTLNYHSVLEFKRELKLYIVEGYKELEDNKFDYLKEFGDFKAERLESTEIDISDVYSEIRDIKQQLIEIKNEKITKDTYTHKVSSDEDRLKESLRRYKLWSEAVEPKVIKIDDKEIGK